MNTFKTEKIRVTLTKTPDTRLEFTSLDFDKVYTISAEDQKGASLYKDWSSTKAMLNHIALMRAFVDGLKVRGAQVNFQTV